MADLRAIAIQKAADHKLHDALVCAIVEQESSWNPWAIRYEPAFFEHYIQGLNLADATEARGRSFSWGLMQVMGQTAREHGFQGHLASLCDPEIGLDIGCKVFTSKLDMARGDVGRALLLWNGGGNENYPKQVLARITNYQQADLSAEGDV